MSGSSGKEKTVLDLVSRKEEYEEKIIRWEIKDFPEFVKLGREELHKAAFVFETGHSIGIPVTWRLSFTRLDVRDFSFGIILGLVRTKAGPPPMADASFSVAVKDGNKVIWEGIKDERTEWNLTPHNFFRIPNTFEATAPGLSDAKICITVKTYKNTKFLPVLQKKLEFDPAIFKEKLVQDFSNFFHSKDKSDGDVSIRVPSENGFYFAKAHKAVLAARSTVFLAMFAPNKKMLEGEKGEVLITDLTPLSLRILLEYIYTGKVSEQWEQVPGEVLNAAEKYALPELKAFCGQGLAAIGNRNMQELLELAKLHSISDAEEEIKGSGSEGRSPQRRRSE